MLSKQCNCAISFVIAPPGKKTGAIMKLISGHQIGQKWSYMPYYITVPLLPFYGYEIGQSVKNCLNSFDIPADVINTARVKVAFSTFNTLSRYSSFFLFSFI